MTRPLLAFVLVLLFAPAAYAQGDQKPEGKGEDAGTKVAIALAGTLVGSVLTFLANLYFTYRKEKKEPRKELGYSVLLQSIRPSTDEENKDGIQLFYQGREYKELTTATVHVENSGNTTVKNHFIRFEFPPGGEILHKEVSPKHSVENPVEIDPGYTPGPNEARYKLGRIGKGHRVTFKFYLTGGLPTEPVLHLDSEKAEDDEAELVRGVVSKQAEDDFAVMRLFVSYLLVFFFAPHLFDFIPFEFGRIFSPAGFIRAAVALVILLNIRTFTRTIHRLMRTAAARLLESSAADPSHGRGAIVVTTAGGAIIATNNNGDVTVTGQRNPSDAGGIVVANNNNGDLRISPQPGDRADEKNVELKEVTDTSNRRPDELPPAPAGGGQ